MNEAKHVPKMKLILVFVVAAIVLALCACAPSSGSGKSSSDKIDPSAYPQGSLYSVHVNGELDGVTDFSKKLCLSCHDRKAIIAANENWGGVEGVNPHAAHTESFDCVKCHSVKETSVLVCNDACHHHEWKLPDGWQNPTKELPSADGTAV